ncbi:MAG: hypothetical protein PHY40_02910 [Patescibacteria group bacterium]|nr:hypothetical protein [Patescibacteria group bacterium]
MKIETFNIVIGDAKCNAKCPFCTTIMTGFEEIPQRHAEGSRINEINLKKACKLACLGSATTVLLTGKGEPTLYPNEITEYMERLWRWNFPIVELQTNGIIFGKMAEGKEVKNYYSVILEDWYEKGLNTIAISAVHYDKGLNKLISDDCPDLAKTIKFLHCFRFAVRLNIIMLKNFIDSPKKVFELINWCRNNDVDQLTIRPARKPEENQCAVEFTNNNCLGGEMCEKIEYELLSKGSRLMSLDHGTVVNIDGQNICIADCLSPHKKSEIRTLIFYSNGLLTYDWQLKGAKILRGRE